MRFIVHPADLKDLIDSISIAVKDDYYCKNTVTKYKLPKEALDDDTIDAIINHFLNSEPEYEKAYIEGENVLVLHHPQSDD